MLKLLGLLFAFLLLTACQQNTAPSYVSAPTMVPPAIEPQQPRPTTPSPVNPPSYTPPAVAAGPRAWMTSATPWSWRWIVIHHSDTPTGSAAVFDRYHRNVRHWNSLGYHFVVDNGNGGPDGRIEVGPRWSKQEVGAHAGVKLYNEYGIGICLVGDFNTSRPTPAQMRSLAQLVAYLMRTYRIPADHIIGHRDVPGKITQCPGRHLSVATVRRMASGLASLDPVSQPGHEVLASRESLYLRAQTE